MATVHIGRLLGQVGFSRTIAIKRMHEHCARDPDFVSMFIDEARLVARIRHPNVVPTLDVVVLEGELFLVMEYVQGETLARLIRRSFKSNIRIAPRIASSVIAGALEGLNAAHDAVGEHGEALSIVHRDVSPHNIMVGNDGVSRVLDFGVAKAANRLQTTRNGQIKGKVEYMAPEQLRGSLVDRRTDVYAAACCLWEMLTGRRLYTADNPVALWGKVLEGKAEPPSTVVPEVPRELDEITMRGLEPDPTKRYQTAEDMAIALEQMVGIATPREVGRWVDTLAGKKLRERSGMIAELDSIASEISWSAEDAASDISSVVSQVSSKHAPLSAHPSDLPVPSEPTLPSGVKRSPGAVAAPPPPHRIPRPSSSGLASVPSAKAVVPAPPPSALRPAKPSIAQPVAPKPPIARPVSASSEVEQEAKAAEAKAAEAKAAEAKAAEAKAAEAKAAEAKAAEAKAAEAKAAEAKAAEAKAAEAKAAEAKAAEAKAAEAKAAEAEVIPSPFVGLSQGQPGALPEPAPDPEPVAPALTAFEPSAEPQLDAASASLSEPSPFAAPTEALDVDPVLPMRRGPSLGLIVAGAVGVIVAVAGGWYLLSGSTAPPTSNAPASVATSASPAPDRRPAVMASATVSATASAEPPAAPAKVSLRIVVTPQTAIVLIDGQRVDERELKIGVSNDPVKISAQAPGYETSERQFVPASDGSIVFELKRRVVNTKPTATVKIKGPVETEL
jgi:eukaryotic-like serine/threonine-protein kinase